MTHRFHMVDVFAERRYAGNPLAVVLGADFESAAGADVAWFVAPPVSLGQTCPPRRIAAALGILPEDISAASPVQQLSAGTSAMIVPLRSMQALRRSRLLEHRVFPDPVLALRIEQG